MSALLKNQIAKQLARFTKNLSPNKISLKFLKGEGELHNLELNEKILTELLELPPWLRLTKAVCNKISAKIHWTRLKTDPICLYLDCVEVSMEAATDMVLSSAPQASPHQTSQIPAKDRQPTKYGFVEKVVDGMFVQINSVIVSFKSTSFLATVNMSRLIIQSTSHEWEPADLRMTRIKDDIKRQVLTFKQITWSTLRIDANALYNHQTCYQTNSPLRVITNNSSLNITIKKCTEDCSVLFARLELFLDEILWVLNQSQLQALAGFLNSISAVFDKTKTTKEPEPSPMPAGQAAKSEAQYSRSNMQGGSDKTSSNPLFQKFDVTETSYHLRTGRIDLHLCDDSSLTEQSKNSTANENSGGAMQIQINKLALDHYPFHLAGTSRTGWPCHNEASLQRAYWVKQLLNTFRTCLRNKSKPSQAPLVHLQQSTQGSKTQVHLQQSHSAPASPRQARKAPQQHQGAHSLSNPQKPPVFMYESCFVIRCEEFLIQPVTMSDSRGSSVPFFSSDKKALFLPSDMPAFQLDYTQYYYPAGVKFTVPAPNLFVQLNPVQLTLDPATCVWFNQFMHSILCGAFSAEGLAQQPLDQSPSHIDIRVEALMPKVNIPCPSDPNAFYKEFRPQGLQLQMSQVFITNSRTGTNSTQSDLLMVLQEFQASKLYTDLSVFPNNLDDFMPLPNVAWVNDSSVVDEASMERNISGIQENGQDSKQLSQVWCIFAEQMWLDFIGVTSANGRPVPFVDAIPLHLWICTPLPAGDANMTEGCARAVNRGSFEKDLPISFNSPPNVARETFSRRKVLEPLTAGSTLKTQTNSLHHNSISSPNLHQKTELSNGEQQNHNRGLSEGSEFYARCFDRDCNSLPASPRRFHAKKNLEETQEESQPIKKPLCQVTSCSSVTSTNSSSSLPSVPDSENSQDDYIMVEKEISEPPPAYEENLPGMNIANGHCVRDTPETVLFDEKPPPYEAPLHTGEGPCHVNSLNMYQNCNGALPAYSTVPQDNKGLKHINGPPNSLLSEAPTEEAPPLPKKAPLPRGTIQYFTDNEENQMMKSNCSQVADMTVLVAFHDTVKLQLDHFQFVSLLRMQEMLTKLMEDIDRDRSKFDVKRVENQATKDPAVSCHLLLKGAEVNVVLPPSPESSQSVGVCHGNTSTVSSFQDTGIVSDNGSETSGANGLTPDSLDIDGDKVSELPEDNSQNCEIEGRNSEFRMNADSSPISSSSSRSDSAHVSDVLNVQNDALNVQNDVLGRVSVASDVSSEVWMLGMESGQSSHAEQGSRRNSEGSCTSMGRDSSLSLTDNKIVKTQKCQKVSIVTVKGSNIQLGVQMKGEDLAVKIAVQKVDLAETGNVNFEKFINRKSTKTNCTSVGTPIPEIDSREPMGAIRLDFGPMASKLDPVAPERGFAHIKLSEIVASLLISNAESLGDFIEDEVVIPPMPFVVELRNSEVTIINDAPPRLLSAPPAIPINLGIQSVTVRRDENGTISVNGMQTSGGSESQCFRQSSSEPSLTNDLTSENYRLAERLAVTQTALRSVQEEREALLKTIERLRTELAISNREQEQIQEKLLLLTYPRGSSPRKGYR